MIFGTKNVDWGVLCPLGFSATSIIETNLNVMYMREH